MCEVGKRLFETYDRLAFLYLTMRIFELKDEYERTKQEWKSHQEECETCMLKPKFHSLYTNS